MNMKALLIIAIALSASQTYAFLDTKERSQRFVNDDGELAQNIRDGILTAECLECKCTGRCLADPLHVLETCKKYVPFLQCPDHCASNPCVHGLCHEKEDLTSFWCECLDGYRGEKCEAQVASSTTPCLVNTCKNNGVCMVNTNGDTSCTCHSGYFGINCEIYLSNLDYCLNVDCQNNGTCIVEHSTYKCACQAGYSGKNCETYNGFCNTNSDCHNNGACIQHNGFFNCKCNDGWVGNRCQNDVNECIFDACQNNGTCVNLPGTYTCHCPSGWGGTRCEQDIDECMSTPCLNNATCINTIGSYHCNCSTGLVGDHCQTDIDECSSSPCKHGASCRNTHGSYECDCVSGWEGRNCENDLDECTAFPLCHNGALCTNIPGSFYCTCAAGWKGTQCHLDIDECLRQPCLHGGACTNTKGSYVCQCKPGYSGHQCQDGPPSNCDHICTLQSAVKANPVYSLHAAPCPGSSILASNEALPMKCCGLTNPNNWKQGQKIMALCDQGISMSYKPVAAFRNGMLIPDTAGVLNGCLSQGARGFTMVIQTCTKPPQVFHVNSTSSITQGVYPDNYFFIL